MSDGFISMLLNVLSVFRMTWFQTSAIASASHNFAVRIFMRESPLKTSSDADAQAFHLARDVEFRTAFVNCGSAYIQTIKSFSRPQAEVSSNAAPQIAALSTTPRYSAPNPPTTVHGCVGN